MPSCCPSGGWRPGAGAGRALDARLALPAVGARRGSARLGSARRAWARGSGLGSRARQRWRRRGTSRTARSTPRAGGRRARSVARASPRTRCAWPSWCRYGAAPGSAAQPGAPLSSSRGRRAAGPGLGLTAPRGARIRPGGRLGALRRPRAGRPMEGRRAEESGAERRHTWPRFLRLLSAGCGAALPRRAAGLGPVVLGTHRTLWVGRDANRPWAGPPPASSGCPGPHPTRP